jgi:hypothetical protein
MDELERMLDTFCNDCITLHLLNSPDKHDRYKEKRTAVLAAMRKGGVPEGEQKAFETWARERGLCLDMHPLHYLFLDADTNLARQAWKAAMLAAAPQPPAVITPRVTTEPPVATIS